MLWLVCCWRWPTGVPPMSLTTSITSSLRTAGSRSIRCGSITAPVPQPIIARSIIRAKASQSTRLVEVQLYAPEKFSGFSIHAVPPIHSQRPEGRACWCFCIRPSSATSASLSLPSLRSPPGCVRPPAASSRGPLRCGGCRCGKTPGSPPGRWRGNRPPCPHCCWDPALRTGRAAEMVTSGASTSCGSP
jgi:hypothetical protein